MNISYRRLNKNDDAKVRKLVEDVYNKLENKDFFIPISESEFEELYEEEIGLLYGAFDGEKLVGISKLDKDNKYVVELKELLNIQDYKVSEMGRYLVLEEYRNNGIMFELEKMMIKDAIEIDYNYVIATVHPDNIPSNKTILKAGLQLHKTTVLTNGFLRNIYVKRIK